MRGTSGNPNPRKKTKSEIVLKRPREAGLNIAVVAGNQKTVRNCVEKTRGGRSQYRRSCGEPRVTLTLTLEKKMSEIVLKRPGEAGLNIAVVAGKTRVTLTLTLEKKKLSPKLC